MNRGPIEVPRRAEESRAKGGASPTRRAAAHRLARVIETNRARATLPVHASRRVRPLPRRPVTQPRLLPMRIGTNWLSRWELPFPKPVARNPPRHRRRTLRPRRLLDHGRGLRAEPNNRQPGRDAARMPHALTAELASDLFPQVRPLPRQGVHRERWIRCSYRRRSRSWKCLIRTRLASAPLTG
jgi:hypothetical protein